MGINMAKMQDMAGLNRRVVCWFSAGDASAVAAKLAVDKYPHAILVYIDTGSEHEDNPRFIRDVEVWLDRPVYKIKSEIYSDIWQVFKATRWLVGPAGARCTTELKKKVRQKFEKPDDLQVFGYTIEEKERLSRFANNNPEMNVWCPLIDRKLSKSDCHDIVSLAGIELPVMYKQGFRNNNCLGCPKGGQKYWGRTRKFYPEIFERMSKVERKLDVAINKSYAGDGERKKVFLDELPDDILITEPEQSVSCGLFCGQYLEDE
jgi:3'-phosphoadenosine 5'-phosphosulfate sulfotransferase (PAPS reductase)/FAD synthetase